MADAFVEWSVEEKNRQVIEAKDFIGQQLSQAEIRLKEADDELQAFQEQHLDELSLSPDTMSRLQQERESIRQRFATLGLQVQQLRARGSKGANQIDWISPAELNNSMLEKFNTELIELQLQKERLLVYQTEVLPEVQVVENKIQTLVSNLVREYADTLKSLARKASRDRSKARGYPEERRRVRSAAQGSASGERSLHNAEIEVRGSIDSRGR